MCASSVKWGIPRKLKDSKELFILLWAKILVRLKIVVVFYIDSNILSLCLVLFDRTRVVEMKYQN